MLVGGKHFSMASVFAGSTRIPDGLTMCPNYSSLSSPKQYFFHFSFKIVFLQLIKNPIQIGLMLFNRMAENQNII